jgi:hypothetical protein
MSVCPRDSELFCERILLTDCEVLNGYAVWN